MGDHRVSPSMMKAIQISRLQATIAAIFAVLAGMSGPMVRRSLTVLLQSSQSMAGSVPLNPNMATGFELVGIITASGFLLAWATIVTINRLHGRPWWMKWGLLSIPLVLGFLALAAVGRLQISGSNIAPGPPLPNSIQVVRDAGSAAVSAVETFWLSGAVLAVLMLTFYLLAGLPKSSDGGREVR